MHHSRIYVIQLLGIFLLMCGYLFSNRPDRYSAMHFNLQANHVFAANDDDDEDDEEEQVIFVTPHHHHHHHTHKYRVSKLFSFKIVQPVPPVEHPVVFPTVIQYVVPLKENYHFLFCKEINPPPPKAC